MSWAILTLLLFAAIADAQEVLHKQFTLTTNAEVTLLLTASAPGADWGREGADAPLVPSVRSTAYGQVNQLRDPAIFEENGQVYLVYAVAGESGIAIAELRPR